MKNKDRSKSFTFLIVVFVVILCMIFLASITISSKTSSHIGPNIIKPSMTGMVVGSSCEDSDGGINYYTYGQVTYRNKVYKDSCSSYTLIEQYCKGSGTKSSRSYVTYVCPDGCSGGACICIPKTCSQLKRQCGTWGDGCGGTVNCGSCSSGFDCQNGTCVCVPSTEICDNKDNDCDGSTDEGLVQQCGTSDVGACEYGTSTCSAGVWGSCQGNIDPRPEVCDGVIDDDCDGIVDNGCSCVNGRTKECGISNAGECKYGISTCANGSWGDCVGEVIPSEEVCDNKDNNCDGIVDNNLTQQCGISNIGDCMYGTSTCSAGVWGSCQGNIDPRPEVCDGIHDEDCDGVIDEGCQCIDGQTKSCGSDIGECIQGIQICSSGLWGACLGEIGPSTELCDNKDNDCDNQTDEGLPITCNYGTDCGINGWTGSNYCGADNNVYRNWINYQCNNAGKCSSSCSSTTTGYLVQNCVNQSMHCSNGACVSGSGNNTCTDTDGGIVYNITGTATGLNGIFTDNCWYNKTLTEYYCLPSNNVSKTYYNCSFMCLTGRCY